jgi:hypothetical protein
MRPHTWNFQEILRRRDRSRVYAALAFLALAISAVVLFRSLFKERSLRATMSAATSAFGLEQVAT